MTTVVVLAVAFLKLRFVLHDFMELRDAPGVLRLLADAWVAGGLCALLVIYRVV